MNNTSELRGEVSQLLTEMEAACHRPLFSEISRTLDSCHSFILDSEQIGGEIHPGTVLSSERSKKRRRQNASPLKTHRRWDEILKHASALLPFMTHDEHARASRLAMIFLFGYLIPDSTGNDFGCVQTVPQKVSMTDGRMTKGESSREVLSCADFINMDIEERLENCSRFYAAQNFGEMDSCVDETIAKSFRRFLEEGLSPFLAGRESHSEETDLLHIIAMAISPSPAPVTPNAQQMNNTLHPSQKRAIRLLSTAQSNYFFIGYAERTALVRVVAEHLILPEYNPLEKPQDLQGEDIITEEPDSPLFHGAMMHLRASLHTFARGAMNHRDSHLAYQALSNIAIRSGLFDCITEEWDALLKRILDDNSDYDCACKHQCDRALMSNQGGTCSLVYSDVSKCPHLSRGKLLMDFVMKYNGSRHFADDDFTRMALVSLSAAIEARTKLIFESNTIETNELPPPACQLAALLRASRSLFYFLLPSKIETDRDIITVEINKTKDPVYNEDLPDDNKVHINEERCKAIIAKSATFLLRHPNRIICCAASSLVGLMVAYSGNTFAEKYAADILLSIQLTLKRCWGIEGANGSTEQKDNKFDPSSALQCVVSSVTRYSPCFTNSLLKFLISQAQEDNSNRDISMCSKIDNIILSLIVSISLSQPRAVVKHSEILKSLFQPVPANSSKIAAIWLSFRLAYFAPTEQTRSFQAYASQVLQNVTDPLELLNLSKHALTTTNYGIASGLFNKLMLLTSSEQSFLYLKSLSKVSEAEHTISQRGTLGIPLATPLLNESLSCFRALTEHRTSVSNFSFQIELIRNRIDFLELIVTARGLCAEMTLTGAAPHQGTRSFLHQRNTTRCFYALSARYYKIYRLYGIMHCQQTRTSLRTAFVLCQFFGDVCSKVFYETRARGSQLDAIKRKLDFPSPKGDCSLLLSSFLKRMREQVIDQIRDGVINPVIRATALMDIIDAILNAPLPFPRGFMNVNPPPLSTLRVSADPNSVPMIKTQISTDVQVESEMKDDINDAEVVDVALGMPFTLFVSGTVPPAFFSRSKLSCSQILVWYTISYDGPLYSDDDEAAEDQETGENSASEETTEGSEAKLATALLSEQLNNILPLSSPVLPEGKFLMPLESIPIMREGFYKVQMKLGCRDVRCGEWEIPTPQNSGIIFLCASSSHGSQSREDETVW